jgi:SAM-dependent methyltransferase
MPEHRDRERLRTTFASVAEEYERARPTYPAAVFDDIAELGGLRPGARVLEIGPGTGQATVELARRGYAVTAVELAEELAAVARRKLAGVASARVVVADFESWRPRAGGFDAVVAFTSFHWVAPELRYAKPAALLRPDGALGVVATHHVLPEDADPVWAEVQQDYDAVIEPGYGGGPPQPPGAVGDLREEMEASGSFGRIAVGRRRWDVSYSADEWVAVLGTYSENIAMPAEQREKLFHRIHARIAAKPGGRATRHYLAVVTVGRRR